jgi:hypothetical protein
VHLLKDIYYRRVYQTPRGGASHHHVTYNFILLWPASNKAEDQIVELWNFPIDGGASKRFYEGNEFAFGNLRFHPDGKRFAFRMKSMSYEIWAMDNFLPEKKK